MTEFVNTTEIAPGVLVLKHPHVEGNTGVIVGATGAVVVDTGPDLEHAKVINAALANLSVPVVATALTHGHWDHVLGGSWGQNVYAHEAATLMMRTNLTEMSRMSGLSTEKLEATLPWPTVTTLSTIEYDLGSRSITLIPTPGHSPDSVCVLVEDCGVLFGGDTLVTCIPPVFRDGDSANLETTLEMLADLVHVSTIVPGHGDLVHEAAIPAALAWPLDYVRSLRLAVKSSGSTNIDDLVRLLDYETFIGDRFDRDLYRMDWRHQLTIETLLAEQQGGAS
jgi:glyoxylase-like metal-dependent hydrolase (beta-lactamase superfamily II)